MNPAALLADMQPVQPAAQEPSTASVMVVFLGLGLLVGHWLFRSKEEFVCSNCGNSVTIKSHCEDCGSQSTQIVETTRFNEFKKFVGSRAEEPEKDYPKTVEPDTPVSNLLDDRLDSEGGDDE